MLPPDLGTHLLDRLVGRYAPRCEANRRANGARCNSSAQTVSEAQANAATKLLPSPCSTGRTPPWAATTPETVWLRRATAAVITSGWVSHSRVEPSTSAKSSVTIPVGKSLLTPRSLQFTSAASARGVDLAHASQHGSSTWGKPPAETHTTAGSPRRFMRRARGWAASSISRQGLSHRSYALSPATGDQGRGVWPGIHHRAR
jgi:hypothetical protein